MTDELDELLAQWNRWDSAEEEHTTVSAAQRAEWTREIESLADTAYEFYALNQYDSAAPLYSKAYHIAVKSGNTEQQAEYKYWEGHCHRLMGHLREGLACLLELDCLNSNPPERLHGLIDQIIIAIRIPISLRNIEALIRRCRDDMERFGLQASRSMLLSVEYTLAYYRKDFATELSRAQETLSTYEVSAYRGFDIYCHYVEMIDAFLDNGDRLNAERWLGKLEAVETRYEASKELSLLSFKRRLALMDGDHKAAWNYAQRYYHKAREAESSPYGGLKQLAEAGIECRHLLETGQAVWELLSKHRNSENGHRRYAIRRLAGDYYRAMSQRATSPMDEGGKETAFYRRYEDSFRKNAMLARRYYEHALKVGQFIDERLCCDWHEKEIRERLRSLE